MFCTQTQLIKPFQVTPRPINLWPLYLNISVSDFSVTGGIYVSQTYHVSSLNIKGALNISFSHHSVASKFVTPFLEKYTVTVIFTRNWRALTMTPTLGHCLCWRYCKCMSFHARNKCVVKYDFAFFKTSMHDFCSQKSNRSIMLKKMCLYFVIIVMITQTICRVTLMSTFQFDIYPPVCELSCFSLYWMYWKRMKVPWHIKHIC